MISPTFSPTVVPPNTWPHVSSFIIGLQVVVGHIIKCNSKDKIWIRMSDKNGNTLHADLHGWIFVPGLNRHLFSITKFVENGHRATFQKHTITVYFGLNKFPVTIPIPTSIPNPHVLEATHLKSRSAYISFTTVSCIKLYGLYWQLMNKAFGMSWKSEWNQNKTVLVVKLPPFSQLTETNIIMTHLLFLVKRCSLIFYTHLPA